MNFIRNVLSKINPMVFLYISLDILGVFAHFTIFNLDNRFCIRWGRGNYKSHIIFKLGKDFNEIILSVSKYLDTLVAFKAEFVGYHFRLFLGLAILGVQCSINIFVKLLHILYFILVVLLVYGLYYFL